MESVSDSYYAVEPVKYRN